MTRRIEISQEAPFVIAGKQIAYIEAVDISLKTLSGLMIEASRGDVFEKEMNRLRIVNRLIAHTDKGEAVKIDGDVVKTIPARYATEAVELANSYDGIQGEIISGGDGATSPILLRLGSPINMTSDNEKIKISEIEFQAKTYGDVENVLATKGLEQVLVFIRDCGTPIITGSDKKLMSLPETAIDQITAEDGVFILAKVMPSFLG